jgi:hypothetical protein
MASRSDSCPLTYHPPAARSGSSLHFSLFQWTPIGGFRPLHQDRSRSRIPHWAHRAECRYQRAPHRPSRADFHTIAATQRIVYAPCILWAPYAVQPGEPPDRSRNPTLAGLRHRYHKISSLMHIEPQINGVIYHIVCKLVDYEYNCLFPDLCGLSWPRGLALPDRDHIQAPLSRAGHRRRCRQDREVPWLCRPWVPTLTAPAFLAIIGA